MSKPKQTVAKSKTKSSKYSKLMANSTKELNDKKKALVKAEKDLAKASKTHSDLLGEVARLDMLERSLKALVEGTEPPQNVKYVYNYPNWIWSYPWWWGTQYYYPNNYYINTLPDPYYGTLGTLVTNTQTGVYNSGAIGTQTGIYNSGVDSGSIMVNCQNSSNTVASTTTATGSNILSAGTGLWNTVNTTVNTSTDDLVIDLSTSATDESSDIKASESTESLVGIGEN